MAEHLLRLRELARAPRPRDVVGGKAASLARLLAAGVPVPDGAVIPPGAPVPPPEALADLGDRLAVRSSATVEDGSEAAAPGLFASVVDVPPSRLAPAIREVRSSAEAPGVRAYLKARGLGHETPRLAVLVQRRVEGIRGVAYTRPPGLPESETAILEVGGEGEPARRAYLRRSGEVEEVDPGFPLSAAQAAKLWHAALAAERALGLERGADIEWVSGREIWLVQARPIVHRPRAPAAPIELFAFSRREPELVWRWDVTHNPDPLSPAQIALVERESPRAPFAMEVVGGYLYTASSAAPAAPAPVEAAADATEASRRLRELFFDRVAPEVERALAPIERAASPALEDALAAYDRVFELYACELTPAVERARSLIPEALWLAAEPEPIPPSREELAAMSPAWDVAVPTFGERDLDLTPPTRAKAASREPEDPGFAPPLVALAKLARAVGEADDRFFFRAQAAVRRALLCRAAALGLADPSDLFYCDDPLGAKEPAAIARQAAQGRRRIDVQRRVPMPLAFSAGRPIEDAPMPRAGDLWRGRGTGGRARGRVIKLEAFGTLRGEGTVLVTRAVSPATVVSLPVLEAIVCEHGGLLGHGAAMARELGIPCVVGCSGAWSELSPGDEVWVDGDRGLVIRL